MKRLVSGTIGRILFFAKKPTSRNIIINTLGNYLNVVFTAFFALILWQILTPAQYGVFSVLLGIAYVLTNILDFGTTATIYSYLPDLYHSKSIRLYSFIKSTVFYQSAFSIAIIVGLFITFPYLDKVFFKTGAPTIELYLTAISVLFFVWQQSVLNMMFAAKKFVTANIYLNLTNLIKTIIILIFVAAHSVTVGSIMFIFGVVGPLIFFLLVVMGRKGMIKLLAAAPVNKEEFKFKYTLTYFIASQFYNVGMRMDLFLLSHFGLRDDVGYYGISQKIILTIISTIVSITQVLSPGFARIKNRQETLYELKTSFMYLLAPTALFILLFIMPDQIYILFFHKEKIAQAAPHIAAITKSLALPFILNALGSIPLLYLLYTIKKPFYILIGYIMFFITVTAGCYLMIPKYGVFGPAYALTAAFIITTAFLTIASMYEYKKLHMS